MWFGVWDRGNSGENHCWSLEKEWGMRFTISKKCFISFTLTTVLYFVFHNCLLFASCHGLASFFFCNFFFAWVDTLGNIWSLQFFRHFCRIGSPFWCLQGEGTPILQECIFRIHIWFGTHNICYELVPSCTGWCLNWTLTLYIPCKKALPLIVDLTFVFFQPALLYIVPAVIGFLAVHCIWNGDVKPVCFSWQSVFTKSNSWLCCLWLFTSIMLFTPIFLLHTLWRSDFLVRCLGKTLVLKLCCSDSPSCCIRVGLVKMHYSCSIRHAARNFWKCI